MVIANELCFQIRSINKLQNILHTKAIMSASSGLNKGILTMIWSKIDEIDEANAAMFLVILLNKGNQIDDRSIHLVEYNKRTYS